MKQIGETLGGFSAAFLVYVVLGTLVGLAVAVGLHGRGFLCPTDFFGGVGVRCESSLARTFWYAVADLPSTIMLLPLAVAIGFAGWVPGPTDNYAVVTLTNAVISVSVFAALSAVGFFAWAKRSTSVASLLAAALVGELVFMFVWFWG